MAWNAWQQGWRRTQISWEGGYPTTDQSQSSWRRMLAVEYDGSGIKDITESTDAGPSRGWVISVDEAEGVTAPSPEQATSLRVAGFPIVVPRLNPDPLAHGVGAHSEWANILELTKNACSLKGELNGRPRFPLEGPWKPHLPVPEPCIIHLYAGEAGDHGLRAIMAEETPHLLPHLVEVDVKQGADIFDLSLRLRLMDHALRGHVHNHAAGPDCSSWSVARYRPGSRPIRARDEPDNWWGLDDLDTKETPKSWAATSCSRSPWP